MTDFCIISDKTRITDIEPIFGPCEKDDVFLPISQFRDMADIWVFVGMFPSRGQANKNNHGGPIPSGFTDIWKKKRNIRLTIWNPDD